MCLDTYLLIRVFTMKIQHKHIMLFTIILFGLSSCNNILISNLGIAPIVSKLFEYTNEQQSSYQGSQAYNNSLFGNEEVNLQTGSLLLNRNLLHIAGITNDINLKLDLIYTNDSERISPFWLPAGWSFNLSYLTLNSNQIEQSANINGRNYIIDDNWVDNSGYSSGLKYINNHAIKFVTVIPDKALTCKLDKRKYRYKYSGTNGVNQYFDATGKLLAQDNRFGSCISYYYTLGGVYQSFLTRIVDSYGQEFKVTYNPNKISITNENSTLSSFEYTSDKGVLSFSDALGYKTNYSYTQYIGKNLLTQISYPSGLITQVAYTKIPYKSCNNENNQLTAVSELKQISATNKLLNKTEYTYGLATNGSNFTGHTLGLCIGENTDKLEDSNNYSFRYDVTIKKYGDNSSPSQTSRLYYNFMHLPRVRRLNNVSNGWKCVKLHPILIADYL